ncbi:MAG: hypothetical protein Hals2KO_10580 [Halioglobus sp.]
MAQATVVNDLYTARVAVPMQGAEALAGGARDALAEVLVKASGSYEVLNNEAILAALKDARAHVQQYAYEQNSAGEEGLWARYEFDPTYVTRLLADSGAALWTANRPEVLVWVVLEGPQGRQFVSGESSDGAAGTLARAFDRRGVPQRLPLFDLVDASALSPADAWRLDGSAIKSASARYKLADVVAARVALLSEGSFVGDWVYFSPAGNVRRSLSAESLEDFFRQGVALVADDMAARYAVAPVASNGQGVPMVVTGVGSYADYAAVVRWLASIELLERAAVERVARDRLELRLYAGVDPAQLSALIALNRRLQPVPSGDPALLLNFAWQE